MPAQFSVLSGGACSKAHHVLSAPHQGDARCNLGLLGRTPETARVGVIHDVLAWTSHFRSTPINGYHQTGPVGPVGASAGL
jgi:hypothetical protein